MKLEEPGEESISLPSNLQSITDTIKEQIDPPQVKEPKEPKEPKANTPKPCKTKSSSSQTDPDHSKEQLKTLQKLIKSQAKELESLRKALSSKTSELTSLSQELHYLKSKDSNKPQSSSSPARDFQSELDLKDKQIQDLRHKLEHFQTRPVEIFHKKNNFSESEFWKLDDEYKSETLTLKDIAKNKALWIIKAEEKKNLNPITEKISTPNKSVLHKHKMVRRSLEPLTPKYSSNS